MHSEKWEKISWPLCQACKHDPRRVRPSIHGLFPHAEWQLVLDVRVHKAKKKIWPKTVWIYGLAVPCWTAKVYVKNVSMSLKFFTWGEQKKHRACWVYKCWVLKYRVFYTFKKLLPLNTFLRLLQVFSNSRTREHCFKKKKKGYLFQLGIGSALINSRRKLFGFFFIFWKNPPTSWHQRPLGRNGSTARELYSLFRLIWVHADKIMAHIKSF